MPKAQKKRRGGRPRNVMAPREPNGRQQRGPDKAFQEAIYTRMRLFGLTEKDASNQRAGTLIGRMQISNELSEEQFFMAMKFSEWRHAWLRAIAAKQEFKEAKPDHAGTGNYEDFCNRAIERWNEVQSVLDELCVGARTPAPRAALDLFIVQERYVSELLGDFRVTLNHLNRRLVEGKRRAA